MTDGVLDEAYERMHQAGPEYRGWLSNHGPMAADALVRLGGQNTVHRWLDTLLRVERLNLLRTSQEGTRLVAQQTDVDRSPRLFLAHAAVLQPSICSSS
jgi:hypothetical protein